MSRKSSNIRDPQAEKRKKRTAAIIIVIALILAGVIGFLWFSGTISNIIFGVQHGDNPEVKPSYHTHTYTEEVVSPTCTERGYTLHSCTECDTSYKNDYTAIIPHDYQLVIEEEATYDSYGKGKMVCTMCGAVEYEVTLPLLNKTYTEKVVAPTCTSEGYTVHTCNETGETYTDSYTAKTGHFYAISGSYQVCRYCGERTRLENVKVSGDGFAVDSSTNTIMVSPSIYSDTPAIYDPRENFTTWEAINLTPSITHIVIAEGITSIGDSAFSNLQNITSITLPSTLKFIDQMTFANCKSLESIVIPDSVTEIGDSAFADCTSLKSVTIGKGLKTLLSWTFVNCVSLEEIKFSEGLENMEEFAISGCDSLKSIVLPNSIKNLEKAAISCPNLSLLVIPEGVTEINAFNMSNEGSLYLPSTLKAINDCTITNVYYAGSSSDWAKLQIVAGVRDLMHPTFNVAYKG